jgi:hypothetical protein
MPKQSRDEIEQITLQAKVTQIFVMKIIENLLMLRLMTDIWLSRI